MKIELKYLLLENFKGVRLFHLDASSGDVTIYAENGAGKTTIADAFLWCFFGKNSAGDTKFDICPLDENNQRIKGLVVAVEAMLEIDGVEHVFRKEQHEKVVKGQLTGYEAKCSVDEVPKKKGEYESYIADIIPEDVFKMLTDLQKFNTMHWADRRKILLDIAGEIGTPKGFSKLLGQLGNRSMEDFKGVLNTRKKKYKDERDEINPRLSEINIGMEELGTLNTEDAGTSRVAAIKLKAELTEKRKKIVDDESVRQQKIEALNDLKNEKVVLEATLRQGDTTKIGPLLTEKLQWDEKLSTKRDELATLRKSVSDAETAVLQTEGTLSQKTQQWSLVCEGFRELQRATLDEICSLCKEPLRPEKIDLLKKARLQKLTESSTLGTKLQGEKNALKAVKAKQQEHATKLMAGAIELDTELDTLDGEVVAAKSEIDKKIKGHKSGIDPEKDDEWKRLNKKVIADAAAIGPSAFDQTNAIDAEIGVCNADIEAANEVLNGADRLEKDKARIVELELREKELAQLIADIEKKLQQIDEYGAEESKMVEDAVNGMFKHTTFKLFNRLLNGSIEPTCVAMLNGTPYAGMSTGETIFVGIDIVNVLSKFYGMSVVMFIDHLESLSLPIETDAQVIGLFMEKGIKELTVK